MFQGTYIVLLVVAHVFLGLSLYTAQMRLPKWLAPALGTFATMLFGVLSLSAQNIEHVAQDGSITTTSEPVVGIYALGLAAVAFLLTTVLLIDWLPTPLTGGTSSGF